jgi:hypothetical protein
MSMTLYQLRKNKLDWKQREVYRYRKWHFYYYNSKRPAKERLKLRNKWWKGYIQAREKRRWYEHEINRHSIPPHGSGGVSSYDGHSVANWIIPILQWAKAHGWTGYVVSGYRTPAQQWAAATNYARQLGKPLYSVYPAGPLASNHCRYIYPGGAVDVTNYEQLDRVLREYNGHNKLIWAGPTIGDYVHFSSNGH